MTVVTIAGRDISSGKMPYIVAEVSGEHKQDWNKMVNLITAVKESGADALKVQLYDPLKLALMRGKGDVNVMLETGPWKGKTYAQLYEETYTPRMWFPRIYKMCMDIGLTVYTSIFHEEDLVFLEKLENPAYKIASPELADTKLLAAVAKTRKPMVLSLGLFLEADTLEVRESKVFDILVPAYQAIQHNNVIVLHCVSNYPTKPEDMYLKSLRNYLTVPVDKLPMGLSDHTVTGVAAIVATAYGACMIEKHITLSALNGGWDRSFSLEPRHFKLMVDDVREAYTMIGGKNG